MEHYNKNQKHKIMGPGDQFFTPWQIDANKMEHKAFKATPTSKCSRDMFFEWGRCNKSETTRCEECPQGQSA